LTAPPQSTFHVDLLPLGSLQTSLIPTALLLIHAAMVPKVIPTLIVFLSFGLLILLPFGCSH
jgi:hypothetical protein